MRHNLNAHPPKLVQLIITMPSSKILLNSSISLKMPKSKEMPLNSHKRKLLNIIINLPPHQLSINPKLKQSAILESD